MRKSKPSPAQLLDALQPPSCRCGHLMNLHSPTVGCTVQSSLHPYAFCPCARKLPKGIKPARWEDR